jgi:ATP synthase assembly factor FMC1
MVPTGGRVTADWAGRSALLLQREGGEEESTFELQSILQSFQMSLTKTAYENLHRQLLINTKAATKKQNAQELKKRIALLSYQRINAIKAQESTKAAELSEKIEELKKQTEDPPAQLDAKLVNGVKIKNESPHAVQHISDIANYLSYQRTYNVLIERYNPGLSMTQEDKIRKTAHRVGFELPPDLQ